MWRRMPRQVSYKGAVEGLFGCFADMRGKLVLAAAIGPDIYIYIQQSCH